MAQGAGTADREDPGGDHQPAAAKDDGVESCGMLLSAIHNVNGEEKLNLLMVDPRIPAGAKLY